ncbi:acetolactate synthase 2, chloroplastic-like [Solanum dulcamara]|uniref:acetolactate synthase 2, chloroplastic-like n=1 Tax=Solanum dulcamara TaxID=45834 RepID=UPI0024851F07|nr:acetolactate synthase 2, chloroplastic-like [Solanum dulcamara]
MAKSIGAIKLALQGLNSILEGKESRLKLDFSPWRQELTEQKMKYPLNYKTFSEAIPPQYAIQVLDELTNGSAIMLVQVCVGQHQMWAAQYYKYKKPRQWLTSGGLRAMGFGLPAAIGAAVGRPGEVVVDIDGDGSFIMNLQELATIKVENLPVKIMLLNNQHLGMVVQWEDRFYKANRAHTYLGDPANEEEIFRNMLKFAEACGVPAARVTHRDDFRAAIQKMLHSWSILVGCDCTSSRARFTYDSQPRSFQRCDYRGRCETFLLTLRSYITSSRHCII